MGRKAYLLTDADFAELLSSIDRDPRWGSQGGSSRFLTQEETAAHDAAHRFYNYQLRTWIEEMKK
jgi:hypothetical protein